MDKVGEAMEEEGTIQNLVGGGLNNCIWCQSTYEAASLADSKGSKNDIGRIQSYKKKRYKLLLDYLLHEDTVHYSPQKEYQQARHLLIQKLLELGETDEEPGSLYRLCPNCEGKADEVMGLHLELEVVQMKLLDKLPCLTDAIITNSLFGSNEGAKKRIQELEMWAQQEEDSVDGGILGEVERLKNYLDILVQFQTLIFEGGSKSRSVPFVNLQKSMPIPVSKVERFSSEVSTTGYHKSISSKSKGAYDDPLGTQKCGGISGSGGIGRFTLITKPKDQTTDPTPTLIYSSDYYIDFAIAKYKCRRCPAEYSTSSEFQKHYNSAHLKLRYKCGTCTKEFGGLADYNRHDEEVHKGARFKCGGCEKLFTIKNSLLRHQRRTGCGSAYEEVRLSKEEPSAGECLEVLYLNLELGEGMIQNMRGTNNCIWCQSSYEAEESSIPDSRSGKSDPEKIQSYGKKRYKLLLEYLLHEDTGHYSSQQQNEDQRGRHLLIQKLVELGETDGETGSLYRLCPTCEGNADEVMKFHLELEVVLMKLVDKLSSLSDAIITNSMYGSNEGPKKRMGELESWLQQEQDSVDGWIISEWGRLRDYVDTLVQFQTLIFDRGSKPRSVPCAYLQKCMPTSLQLNILPTKSITLEIGRGSTNRADRKGSTSKEQTKATSRDYRIDPATGNYKCRICSKEFSSGYSGFSLHFKSVHLKLVYSCAHCEKTFTRRPPYEDHIQGAHMGRRFKCDGCQKLFALRGSLNMHQRRTGCGSRQGSGEVIAEGRLADENDDPDDEYPETPYLDGEISNIADKPVSTTNLKAQTFLIAQNDSAKEFQSGSNSTGLEMEAPNVDLSVSEGKVVVKSEPVEDFQDRSEAEEDATPFSDSEGAYDDPLRTKSEATIGIGIGRLSLPTKSKGKTRATPDDYSIDPATKKYKCRICSKEYLENSGFHQHFKSAHLNIRYKCGTCDKEFKRRGDYNCHLQEAHTGARYKCGGCEKIWSLRNSLLQHQRRTGCVAKRGSGDDQARILVTYEDPPRTKSKGKYKAPTDDYSIDSSTGKYKCRLCSKEYFNSSAFHQHYKSAHLNLRIKCDHCEKTFTRRPHYVRHNQTVHMGIISSSSGMGSSKGSLNKNKDPQLRPHQNPFKRRPIKSKPKPAHRPATKLQCNICNKLFIGKNRLKWHQQLHSRDPSKVTPLIYANPETGRFHCPLCPKDFKEQAGFWFHHKTIHLGIRYDCSECDKSFNTRAYRKLHHQKVHLGIPPVPVRLECQICQKSFSRKQTFDAHQRKTSCGTALGLEPFVPSPKPTPGKKQSSSEERNPPRLTPQISANPETGRFQCPTCPENFEDGSSYEFHYRSIHLNMSHLCPECGKVFSTKVYLNNHCQRVHLGVKFECQICKKSYSEKSRLGQHQRNSSCGTALGLQPSAPRPKVMCDLCGREFKHGGILRAHLREVHEKSRKFKCEHCQMTFIRSYARVQHIQSAHLGIRFSCQVCNKSFTQKGQLGMHHRSTVCGAALDMKPAAKLDC